MDEALLLSRLGLSGSSGTASVPGKTIDRSIPADCHKIKLSKHSVSPYLFHSILLMGIDCRELLRIKNFFRNTNTSITSNPPILEPWWKNSGAGHPLSHIGGHNVKKFNQDLHQVFSNPMALRHGPWLGAALISKILRWRGRTLHRQH